MYPKADKKSGMKDDEVLGPCKHLIDRTTISLCSLNNWFIVLIIQVSCLHGMNFTNPSFLCPASSVTFVWVELLTFNLDSAKLLLSVNHCAGCCV